MNTMQTFEEKYKKEALPQFMKKFKVANAMAVPRVLKVVVNVGVGRIKDEKQTQEIIKMLTLITGQKPAPRSAKKAIASFKTRQGQIIGYVVTLRGSRMRDFLDRFIHVALPRSRDFHGISEESVDHHGNLTIGVKEHIVFPEIIGEDYKLIFGFEITIATNAKNRERGLELFRLFGIPFKKK